ncbi:MAG: hypothetical protein JSW58_05615 [Candidatus Latescibacterota bacterium]|nr:MAG: hypothetical protein JSW58_05615 [Candidatus Latescibacterota bacterium]
MKRAIVLLVGPLCAIFVVSLLVAPQSKIQHQDSSAFQMALQQAVDRLEGSGKTFIAGTATPARAAPQQPTFDGRYTCDTYEQAMTTCDPAMPGCVDHTTDPMGHTCVHGEYTCQIATCETYDMQNTTCDVNHPDCPTVPHTTEPPPYHHTCQGHTCDEGFTCDFTTDPRAFTCDAANSQCEDVTFNAFIPTCNPMDPACRTNNPKGYCTADNYPTCIVTQTTCDVADPACDTIDPTKPGCATPTETTTWGKIKERYSR